MVVASEPPKQQPSPFSSTNLKKLNSSLLNWGTTLDLWTASVVRECMLLYSPPKMPSSWRLRDASRLNWLNDSVRKFLFAEGWMCARAMFVTFHPMVAILMERALLMRSPSKTPVESSPSSRLAILTKVLRPKSLLTVRFKNGRPLQWSAVSTSCSRDRSLPYLDRRVLSDR